jgi:hypothetical protein
VPILLTAGKEDGADGTARHAENGTYERPVTGRRSNDDRGGQENTSAALGPLMELAAIRFRRATRVARSDT